MANAPATAPLLHRSLGSGLVLVAVVLLMLRYRGLAPTLPSDSITSIAYALSGFCAVLVAVALFVIKPRVPERRPHQSVDEYWSTPDVSTKAVLVWLLMEGAGMVAAVGYFLTGEPVSALVMGLAIVAFWLCGPNLFAEA